MNEFRAVVGFEGFYEVTAAGVVRSLDREVQDSRGFTRKLKGRILRANKGSAGYPQVSLCAEGVHVTRHIHRLVLDAFKGPRPPGCETLHGDHNPDNPHVRNLHWGTRAQNMAMKALQGRAAKALTDDDVKLARRLARDGNRGRVIARYLKVNASTVSRLLRRRIWNHV